MFRGKMTYLRFPRQRGLESSQQGGNRTSASLPGPVTLGAPSLNAYEANRMMSETS